MTRDVDYVVRSDVVKMSTVVDALLEAIPELRSEVSVEERDQPYHVFGLLARLIQGLVEHRPLGGNEALLSRAFAVVNRLAEVGGEVANLIEIEIVEALAATPELNAAGREFLAERPRAWLEEKVKAEPSDRPNRMRSSADVERKCIDFPATRSIGASLPRYVTCGDD